MASDERRARDSADGLESGFEFETLISDTSALLFAAPPEQLELEIERALESVRRFFRADRCALLSVAVDQQVVNVRLESCGEGVAAVSVDTNLAQLFPWSRHALLVERAPICIARLEDLPPEADAEREAWRQLPIRSALTLPIETGGTVCHIIVLNTVHRERDWPEAFVARLQLLGEILVGALERKEMVDELREVEERMQLAVDSAEAGLWKLDYDTRVFWATERARAIFGFATDEVISIERLEASIHPEDWELVRSAIEKPTRAGEFIDAEFRILPGDGRERWIAASGRYYIASTGAPDRLTGICVDVTERKRAQEALRRSEARLASGADLAGLAFYEVDLGEGAGYRVDDRFCDLCGLPPDQKQGLQPLEFWMEHLHPDDRERVLDQREELHDGRLERVSIEYRYLHPADGEKWIAHLGCVARRNAAGRAVAMFGVLRDITARKRVEEDLLDLSRRLIRAHEEERALLARELHDDVTQRLAVLAIEVGRAESGAPSGAQAEAMKAVREGLVRLSEDIHNLAYQLHPSVLAELGLVEALRTECERVGRQGRIELSVDLDPLPAVVEKDAALCLFRVAQEALNNANRYAGACDASVALRRMDGGLLLAVRDDGVGFDPASPRKGRSLGLASMRERVRVLNGTLDVESAPGLGTAIVAWVPTEGAPR